MHLKLKQPDDKLQLNMMYLKLIQTTWQTTAANIDASQAAHKQFDSST